jgi:acyl-homoserine-lactone acylase
MGQIFLRGAAPVAACVLLLTACQEQADTASPTSSPGYSAELIRTSHGVAHIRADDYGSLGYGEGYAAAQDHACHIARGLVEARGELARYFGPGAEQRNVIADSVVRALDIPAQAREAFANEDETNRDWLTGYSAGYNRYLREQGDAAPGSWCRGADWVRAASPEDFMARMVLVAQTLPRMAAALAAAQPPAVSASAQVAPALVTEAVAAMRLEGYGSNAWALGSERTENGRGLLLANPHYPWYGGNRFWEKHLTIPGELDVYGVHLLGAPGVSIGFNRGVAWSHTVSDSERVVLYQLDLVPGEPTRYFLDGEPRAMTSRTVTVPVRAADGTVTGIERTLWFSHLGPVLTMPGLPWTEDMAFTARDANAENTQLLSQWRDMGRATDMDAFIDAHRRWNAMPWVNTMAVSEDGRALYLDNSTVGHLSEEAITLWRERLESDRRTAQLYAERGMILLDGSDSRFAWLEVAGTPVPGTVPFEQRPRLERRDYIFNANDSYWLTQPEAPLTGYSPLYGPEGTARSPRTRMNVQLLAPDGPYDYAGDDGRFNRREVQQALFSNRSLAAELLRDSLIEACRASPVISVDGQEWELGEACAALSVFNGRFDEDSRGAVLFREWLARYDYREHFAADSLFAEDFDSERPLVTPAGLADSDLALENLAAAVQVLETAGLALDAPLGAVQAAYRADERIPVHGGNSREGVANLQISASPGEPLLPADLGHPNGGLDTAPVGDSPQLTKSGYPIVHGSSFILTLAFGEDGPRGEALLSYSQSGDPGSRWFSDQTDLYRAKQWRPVLFERAAVEADAQSRRALQGPRD